MEVVLQEASNVEYHKNNDTTSYKSIEEEEEETTTYGELEVVSAMPKKEFSRIPETSPVDMQFENITFTASLGWRKGKFKIAIHNF